MTPILILLSHFYQGSVKKQIGKIINLLAPLPRNIGEQTTVVAKSKVKSDLFISVLLDDDATDFNINVTVVSGLI